ncbi:MAG: hypothetical protein A3C84_00115 [Candidatus Ryanbacteria bacterium RIFCSPHIGHO2_02_FULL_48_12]|uniref:Methyltransferase type 11 domain-containing protein n=1 Tax=Candidatus Ryanbacteria bacterium RIFCSPHIGHO2_01_FULL_48_27 TaxID=1802115 RepID=A0A1G2G5C7_9BACT|nr:MAG: hypothetical protein A2756_00320 [Candidatus Ryanbacteria bacterium RIFCSPHIGHO2_01_FULL_48_27]OGZ50381.1 MAG: hypothetical protein A3C84_00115 [Candidatus Ryanbacteria bacterium RIFCSPHIGHO2_02_FULL_48_12]
MDISYEKTYHELEETFWWFVARRDMMRRLLSDVSHQAKVLEVGCASGVFMRELAAIGFGDVWGVDISDRAIEQCKARGILRASCQDAAKMDFPNASFDVLTASDVLEHIADDQAALHEWYRLLRPGGTLVLFVPAHMFLWSPHDVANRHERRYSRLELERKVRGAGFSLERVSYWNTLLFFPIALVRFILQVLPYASRKSTGQLHGTNALINGLLKRLLLLENVYLGSGHNFPFGVSLMVVAKK